jgi:hypothetical protein
MQLTWLSHNLDSCSVPLHSTVELPRVFRHWLKSLPDDYTASNPVHKAAYCKSTCIAWHASSLLHLASPAMLPGNSLVPCRIPVRALVREQKFKAVLRKRFTHLAGIKQDSQSDLYISIDIPIRCPSCHFHQPICQRLMPLAFCHCCV